MKLSQLPLLMVLSLTVPPGTVLPVDSMGLEPVPMTEARVERPLADVWTPRSAHLVASHIRLNGLGIRTHANWVVFRLPFDTTRRDRVRSVRFRPSSALPTQIGALRIGSVCFEVRPAGGVEDWSLFTMSGIGGTERFFWHPAPPRTDARVLGINVPTRVANYASCDLDDGHLRELENWSLDVSWEER
jgi:hypothetical protein